jgi:hypothetical protein
MVRVDLPVAVDPNFEFPPAVRGLTVGQLFPAIPRTDRDLTPPDHIQAIANTAGFHFATIEQGGSSLKDPTVLF